MSWKKQTKNEKIFLDFPSSNQRHAFRYRHGEKKGPEIVFLGKKLQLLDISASGVSFKAENFVAGDIDDVQLDLNDSETRKLPVLSLRIKILSKDSETGVCHCCFKHNTEEQKEVIHQYILDKQKAAIQKRKKSDSSH